MNVLAHYMFLPSIILGLLVGFMFARLVYRHKIISRNRMIIQLQDENERLKSMLGGSSTGSI